MAEHRRQVPRAAGLLAIVVSTAVLAGGCSWSRPEDRATGEMRPVPTVPPTAAPGEELAVTAPNPTGPITTDVIGDPRPDPDNPAPLPPLPEIPAFDACERLGEYGAAEQFGAAVGGAPVTTETVGERGCRFVAGAGVAEIHYLSEDVIDDDWFRRDAIEPVGDVSADAVGIAEFAAPGADSEAGYTIALVSRREGAVVAVRGTPEDRAAAVALANIVEAST
jgi:hypothetical protein